MDRADEIIEEILDSMDEMADKPCINTECAFQDGKCAINGCGGYTTE